MAALTAREIIHAEYGNSRNFMTPNRIRVGKIAPDLAYELASGKNMDGGPLYSVTIVEVLADGTTERRHDLGACSRSYASVIDYIDDLRNEMKEKRHDPDHGRS